MTKISLYNLVSRDTPKMSHDFFFHKSAANASLVNFASNPLFAITEGY